MLCVSQARAEVRRVPLCYSQLVSRARPVDITPSVTETPLQTPQCVRPTSNKHTLVTCHHSAKSDAPILWGCVLGQVYRLVGMQLVAVQLVLEEALTDTMAVLVAGLATSVSATPATLGSLTALPPSSAVG